MAIFDCLAIFDFKFTWIAAAGNTPQMTDLATAQATEHIVVAGGGMGCGAGVLAGATAGSDVDAAADALAVAAAAFPRAAVGHVEEEIGVSSFFEAEINELTPISPRFEKGCGLAANPCAEMKKHRRP
jgi:hypothetical protein